MSYAMTNRERLEQADLRRGSLSLPYKTFSRPLISHRLGLQQLESDLALEFDVFGEIDLTHTPSPIFRTIR